MLKFAAASATSQAAATEVRDGIEDGLRFSGPLRRRSTPPAFLELAVSPRLDPEPAVTCPNWRQIGADALVQGEIDAQAAALRVEIRVLDVSRGCQRLLRKAYRVDPKRAAARRQGRSPTTSSAPSPACPASRTPRWPSSPTAPAHKEIYVMDARRRQRAPRHVAQVHQHVSVLVARRQHDRLHLLPLRQSPDALPADAGHALCRAHPARARRRADLPRRVRPERRPPRRGARGGGRGARSTP